MYLFRVMFFIFAVLFSFSFIANQIPQTVSEPPKEEKFDAALVKTKADVVEIGQKIFFGNGQCALCHSIGEGTAGRCPNLTGIGGKLTREFEYESYTQPEASVYLDYIGLPGEPPKRFAARMPPIDKSPIGLTKPEMLTVFAFLQSQSMAVDQIDITPEEVIALGTAPKGGGAPAVETIVHGNPQNGAEVYKAFACAACHKEAGGDEGAVAETTEEGAAEPAGKIEGPVLSTSLMGKGSGEIRHALFEKPEVHEALDEKMTVRQMNDLLSYLLSLSSGKDGPAAPAAEPAPQAPEGSQASVSSGVDG